jgi:homogentisate 1,2-dioxygenase
LNIKTECGRLEVPPLFVCVIPRGIKFQVNVSEPVRGYICETFKGHFTIPPLGPIGSNGLANPRDFEAPTAWYEDVQTKFLITSKFAGELFTYTQDYSCFDVVGWHGNYYPCRYNLELFNTMNTVSYDHPDPSIFTVLTCPTDEPGVSACDFVIFPPRWMCSEKTFRPPYYHRNNMNEYMGNIKGTYDAKENGFLPGGASLHSTMTGHGPEAEVFKKASTVELKPVKYALDSMAFMFETTYFLKVALDSEKDLDNEYYKCWKGIEKLFKSPQ